MTKIAFLAILLATLIIAGCIGGPAEQPKNETNVTPPPPVVKTPTISISAPLNQETLTVPGDSADITLTTSSQNLVLKKPSGAAKKGEGYLKVTVDTNAPETVTSKTFVMTGLALGAHTVKVELYNNDKTPYSPAISKQVTFTLEKEQPKEYVPQDYTVTINGNSFNPSSITVKVKDRVTFVNTGNIPQSATCSQGGKIVFDTKTIGPGKNATITLSDPMECEYYSQLFRAMKAQIKVEPNGVD
jgi:plastocyanin